MHTLAQPHIHISHPYAHKMLLSSNVTKYVLIITVTTHMLLLLKRKCEDFLNFYIQFVKGATGKIKTQRYKMF